MRIAGEKELEATNSWAVLSDGLEPVWMKCSDPAFRRKVLCRPRPESQKA